MRACALQFLGLLLLQFVWIIHSLISIPWVYHIFLFVLQLMNFWVCCFGFHKKSSHNSYPSFCVAVFSHCLCLWIGLWCNFFKQCSRKPENTLSFILVLALDQDLIHAGQCSTSELLVALKIKHSHWLFSHSYFFYISELS